MNKHAYLIIAHKNDFTFHTLIKSLDSEFNDLYIHMDAKVKKYGEHKIEMLARKSNIIHTQRTNVQWGGYSQINAEIILFEEAVSSSESYSFFHLISGEDLPIKPVNEIHSFFENNNGKNFLDFENNKFEYGSRVKYFYFFQDILGRKRIGTLLNWISQKIQEIININRNKNINFQKGTNWVSINRELVEFILENKNWIEKTFKYTLCADELFIHTLVFNSKFKDTLYQGGFNNDFKSIMRFIDWNRGKPYIFLSENFDELINSPYLFARKFNSEVDREIVKKIYNHIQ